MKEMTRPHSILERVRPKPMYSPLAPIAFSLSIRAWRHTLVRQRSMMAQQRG